MSTTDPPDPPWALDIARPGHTLPDESRLLDAAIRLARAGAAHGGGGPFGAVVAAEGGEIISIGFNQVFETVDSTAHAEIVAIRRAEKRLGSHLLGGPGLPRLRLYTSCAPCIMCSGAIHWCGIPEVVAAAAKEDAEALGFIEGPKNFHAADFFRERGIVYREGVLREEAIAVLKAYKGPVY